MNRNLIIRCFVLMLVTAGLCKALSSSPPPTNTATLTATRIISKHSNSPHLSSTEYLTAEFHDSNSNNYNNDYSNDSVIGEGLFRSFHCNYNRGQREPMKPNYRTLIVKLIQKIRKLSFSLFNKKIYPSIILAVIIALGSFPSHVMAGINPVETASAVMQLTPPTKTIELETEDLITEKYFLQHGSEAEKYWSYDENDDNFFVSGLFDSIENSVTNIEDDIKGYEGEPSTSPDCSISTTTKKKNEEELVSIKNCNNRMIKIGSVGLLLATSTAGTSLLNKKNNNGMINDENAVEQDDKTETMIVPSIDIIETTDLLPLCDPKYVQARKQPKSPKDEALLAARYEAISGLENKSYQILADLGMIDVHRL